MKSSPDRANRIGEALANQNKLIAAVQGAISGATGVVGTAIDIPFSLGLTLRSIYQEGRAHGFELNHRQEQEIVEYVFKQVDLGAIAEKQTLLIALRTITNLIETQDTQQLQTLLGSSNDFSVLKTWLSNQDGTFKWNWLNKIPQISILSKLSPIAGAGIGAVYSWKLVDEAHTKARAVFSGAQQYLLQHPEDQLDVRQAYERGAALLDQATLPDASDISLDVNAFAEKLEQQEVIEVEDAAVHNDTIKAIKIETKSNEDETQSVSVEEGLKALAEKHVEPASEPELQADEEKSLGEAEVLEKPVRKRRSTKKKADVDDALIATDKKQ